MSGPQDFVDMMAVVSKSIQADTNTILLLRLRD